MTCLRTRHFKDLFIKIEEGPCKTYFTDKEAGPWNFQCTEPGLLPDSAAFADHFVWQISILVSIGRPMHYWAISDALLVPGQIEDSKGEFLRPLRSFGNEYLAKYPISGAIFPDKWLVGADTIRAEARRLLDLLGAEVYPLNKDLLLVLFTSECCTQLARHLIYTLDPHRVASGLRRASIVPVKSKDRKKCELTFAVLAHAAAQS